MDRTLARAEKFDQRRKIMEQQELQEIVKRQEDAIWHKDQQLQKLQQQLQQQEQLQQQNQQALHQQQQQLHIIQQQQQQPEGLCLKPEHIINEFRRIKPLDGNHNVRQFILSVESTMALAIGNEALLAYGLRIIVNEKLEGNAGKIVGELNDGATWELVKEKLLNGLQPRKTYAEIFNFCRNVKVSNLDELFTIFLRAKYEINEMYQLDIRKPSVYNPASVDRDLVDLLLEKIDGTVRVHIGDSDTLQDTIAKYTRLKLLTDRRTIDYRHRKNADKKNRIDFVKRNEIAQCNHKDSKANYRPSVDRDIYTNYKQGSGNAATQTNTRQPYFRQTNRREWYPQPSNTGNFGNNGGSRQSKMSTQTIPKSEQSAMETDNPQHSANFITEAQVHNSQ